MQQTLDQISALANKSEDNATQKRALMMRADEINEHCAAELYKRTASLHSASADILRTAAASGNPVVIQSALSLAIEYQGVAADIEREAIDMLMQDDGPQVEPNRSPSLVLH